MKEIIKTVPGWDTMTPSQLLTELTTATIPRENSELLSWAGVGQKIGMANAAAMRLGLERAAVDPQMPLEKVGFLKFSLWALDAGKLDFSLADTQNGLEGNRTLLASLGLPVDALKQLGRWMETPWQAAGLASPPTLAELEAELAAIELEATKTEAMSAGAARWNAFVDALDAWDGSGETPVL
jgi:hypothetical protein